MNTQRDMSHNWQVLGQGVITILSHSKNRIVEVRLRPVCQVRVVFWLLLHQRHLHPRSYR